MIEQYAIDLLRAAIWLLGGLGALIVLLLGGIAALAKWGGVRLFDRLAEQDIRMSEFQQTVANVGNEIKNLLTSETRLLRESQHALSERVGRLEVFRDMFSKENCTYGRRHNDQAPGDE